MTRQLYKLVPMGLGTPYAESLDSYFSRLAFHNGATPGLLRAALGVPSAKGGGPSALIDALAVQAGMDAAALKRLTLLSVIPAVGRQKFHTSLPRWCGYCFRDDISMGTPPYRRLLWTFIGVSDCPEHRVPLTDACPHCNSVQKGRGFRRSLIECLACGRPLIATSLRDIPYASWMYKSKDVADLVNDISTGYFKSAVEGSARTFLVNTKEMVTREGKSILYYSRMSRAERDLVESSRGVFNFEDVRNYAKKFKTSIANVLMGMPPHIDQLPSIIDVPKKESQWS